MTTTTINNKLRPPRNTQNDSSSNNPSNNDIIMSHIFHNRAAAVATDEFNIGPSIQEAVRIIERAYCSYRDKQMFRLLKHAVCAAEHSLSKEILRKIAPQESHLLNDPIFKVHIKFRFSGPEYPPFIVFKIFTHTRDGRTAKYINGKNTIKSTTPAAQEACSQMGTRKFYDMMISDALQEQMRGGKVVHPDHVFSLRDYMQYSSTIDDLPAYMGGRSNSWRRLNLSDLPRYTIFYDVLNYALTKKITKKLAREMSVLLQPPVNSDIQLEHIRIISKLHSSNDELVSSAMAASQQSLGAYQSSTCKSNSEASSTRTTSQSRRRSKNAMSKVQKMKKLYTMNATQVPRSETLNTDADETNYAGVAGRVEQTRSKFNLPDELNDDFEHEVKNLYMWTQNLSMNDDEYLRSPRLGSSVL